MPLARALLLTALGSLAHGCQIAGYESGVCDHGIREDQDRREAEMPFCGRFIKYVPCVPHQKFYTEPEAQPDRNFPHGRWKNHTTLHKDNWIREMVKANMFYRISLEIDEDLQDKGVNEYGHKKEIKPRFRDNDDCKYAYIRYMCWINFPRCDDTENSLLTCQSSCENFFKSCNYEQKLWRCGPSEYFNGYRPEGPTYVDNPNGSDICKPEYYGKKQCHETFQRDYFPGQPFKSAGPCTGAASGTTPSLVLSMASIALCLGMLLTSSSLEGARSRLSAAQAREPLSEFDAAGAPQNSEGKWAGTGPSLLE